MDFDPFHPLPWPISKCALEEEEYMALRGVRYCDKDGEFLKVRKVAVRRILEYSRTRNFDALIPYLAMNYFDRYLSRKKLPIIVGNWIDNTDIDATACLILAWRTRRSSFDLSDFLIERDIIHKTTSIMKAEVQILKALGWNMRSITPFRFLPFLMRKFRLAEEGFIIRIISQIIVETQDEIRFAICKPSIIAVSAVLVTHSLVYHMNSETFEDNKIGDKDELKICMNLIREMYTQKLGMENQMIREDIFWAAGINQENLFDFELKWVTDSETHLFLHPTQSLLKEYLYKGICSLQ